MRSAILVLLASLAATAAGAGERPWKAVKVETELAAVDSCVLVCEVEASATFMNFSPTATPHAERVAYNRAKKITFRAGADTLLLVSSFAVDGAATFRGYAYACRGR